MAWHSQSHKIVALSVTKSEYSAIMEVYCKILFVHVVLLVIEVVVECPINVHIDNVGAIFLSENTSVSQQTKIIDVCQHSIWDYVEDGTVKKKFVQKKTLQIHLKRT